MTKFIIYSYHSSLDEVIIGTSQQSYFEVPETKHIGFEVDDYNENITYQIMIGDFPINEPNIYRRRIGWPISSYLDGASGITPITLREQSTGAVLAQSVALVEADKLSTNTYKIMFDDIRRISVELLLDLVSKSRMTLSWNEPIQFNRVQPLTARLELSQIRRFWDRFAPILVDILEEPYIELRSSTTIRRIKPGEKFKPINLQYFVQLGLRNHDVIHSDRLFVLPTTMPDRNVQENKVVIGFIDILRRRMERSLKRARSERDQCISCLYNDENNNATLKRFLQRREEPKITKLQEIIESSEVVISEMRRIMYGFSIPVKVVSREKIFKCFERPIFSHHPKYSHAARLMRGFLRNTSIIVEQGDAEGAKPIETIFEQWVFFQVSAALQAAGLSCISHNSIFEPIARDRFSVDLDRNAAIEFEAPDKRIVRLRYEPTILPQHSAQGVDTLYRGQSSSPWIPDIVLEVLVPATGQRDYRLAYATVIDAKYTTARNVLSRLEDIAKYRNIRSLDTERQIARQVWVAAPIEAQLQPHDDSITWSSDGEINAKWDDFILGVIGTDPADPDQTSLILKAFIMGILKHAELYALSNNLGISDNFTA